MSSPTIDRFSARADKYDAYRPRYPQGVIDLLVAECGLTRNSIIADVGSGTGILSHLFLQNNNKVFGIEPNMRMRLMGEERLIGYSNFTSVNGSAEATTLPDKSVNFVIVGQAFHWFDRRQTKQEFNRILKRAGWVVLLWNERLLDSSPFLIAYEDLLLRYGTDYQSVRPETVITEIAPFYAPQKFQLRVLPNFQDLDRESLRGRLCSMSYTPEPGHPSFQRMMNDLDAIFRSCHSGGRVRMEYETKVYYGRITPY